MWALRAVLLSRHPPPARGLLLCWCGQAGVGSSSAGRSPASPLMCFPRGKVQEAFGKERLPGAQENSARGGRASWLCMISLGNPGMWIRVPQRNPESIPRAEHHYAHFTLRSKQENGCTSYMPGLEPDWYVYWTNYLWDPEESILCGVACSLTALLPLCPFSNIHMSPYAIKLNGVIIWKWFLNILKILFIHVFHNYLLRTHQ